MPDAAPSVSRSRRSFIPPSSDHRGFDIVLLFSTRQWFTFVPLPTGHLTQVPHRGLFLRRSLPLPLGSSSGRWFESYSCKPVRGAFPHQPYSYAKPTTKLRCSVFLMTQSEHQLRAELNGPRTARTRDVAETPGPKTRAREFRQHH